MNKIDFERICKKKINISGVISEAISYIKNNNTYESDADFIFEISKQIIINREDSLWTDLLELCENALINAEDKMSKLYLYKTYLNYYNYMGMSPKVIEYVLKYEKLGIKDDKDYEVFHMASFSLFETGFYDKSIEYILKAQRAFDDNSCDPVFKLMSYNNLVYCYTAIGRMDRVLESFNCFKQIAEAEFDDGERNEVYKLFKMCVLFVQFKINEGDGGRIRDIIFKYMEYVHEIPTISNIGIMESEDVHLTFIDAMVRVGRIEDAAKVCRQLINKGNISGNKKNIYNRLISIYQLMGDAVSKQEYFDAIVEYNNILKLDNERYDSILHELVGEQFRITDMESKYCEMRNLYVMDSLTDCYNRKAFDKRIEEIKDDKDEKGIVIFFDLDSLKSINDNYGHSSGDIYIRYFSYLTSNLMDSESSLYRYGGDEFVVIGNLDLCEGNKLVCKMKEAFKEPCKLIDKNIYLKFSYGISCYGGNIDIEKAVILADKKMYENKKEKKRKRMDLL